MKKLLALSTDISNNKILLSEGNKPDYQRLPLFLSAVLFILIIYAIKQPVPSVWIKAVSAFVLLMGALLLKKFLFHPIFWFGCLGYCMATLIQKYFWAANHHFVACYLLMAIIVYVGKKENDEKIFTFHLRFIIGCVLMFSALHKFLSASYMSGAFFQMQMNLNIFLKPLGLLLPEWKTITNSNQSIMQQLLKSNPNHFEASTFQAPISNLNMLAKYSSWGAMAMEALAAIAIFFKSEKLYSHWLFCATILGVFIFRLETGFLSLLAIMGFYLAPSAFFQKIYLGCVALFSLLIISGYGLR